MWLVLDATTGQNALAQARAFKEAVGVTGVILAKLDASARGGMAFAIHDELDLPIMFVGVRRGAGRSRGLRSGWLRKRGAGLGAQNWATGMHRLLAAFRIFDNSGGNNARRSGPLGPRKVGDGSTLGASLT